MKIVHIIGRFTTGGAEIFLRDLVCELNTKENIEIEVWALSRSNNKDFEQEYIECLEIEGIKTRIFNKRHKKDKIKTIFKLRKEIIKSKPSLINCHLEEVTLFTCIANLFTGIPVLQTIHNCKISLPKIQKNIISHMIEKYIAISESVKHVLIEDVKIKEEQIETIFNGIHISKFIDGKKNINDKITNIVAIGRLTEQKNHELLIKSFSRFIKQSNIYDMPILNIYGEGELENHLLEIINENGMQEYIKLRGVSNNIPSILNNSDIYIMSSLWEGLSISLIEASISGIPIIATNVGSNYESIEDGINGYLVECSEEELCSAIEKIYDASVRQSFNRMSKIIINKFNIKNTSDRYFNMYYELIK